MNGDDYGLHAIGITLSNSVPILERVRALFNTREMGTRKISALDWSKVRVAPVAVTRQNKVPCRFPGIAGEVAANSLIQFKMRQALRPDSPSGFEFASRHWSFCPASRYVEAIFAKVYETARKSVSV